MGEIDEIRERLWNDELPDPASDGLLEQYKLYVEMAVRISDRRQFANLFFLGLNAMIAALIGVFTTSSMEYGDLAWRVMSCFAGMVLCCAWWILLTSLRNLNTSKFQVVQELENGLPMRPSQAEAKLTDYTSSTSPHRLMGKVEGIVPWIYFGLYLVLMLITVLTKIGLAPK